MRNLLPLLLLLLLPLFPACSPDSSSDSGASDPIAVSLAVTTFSGANDDWTYKDGVAGEFIDNGFCVIVDAQTQTVEKYIVIKETGKDAKEVNLTDDSGKKDFYVKVGRKIFYTFVNLTKQQVEDAANRVSGSGSFSIVEGQTLDIDRLDKASIAVRADGFASTDHIPMTGCFVRELVPSAVVPQIKLFVVRMMAKLQFDFTNDTEAALTVRRVSIKNLADNPAAGKYNLMLFPSHTPSDDKNTNVTMKPNLTADGKASYSKHTYDVNESVDPGKTITKTVYINETEKPNTDFGEFLLTVDLETATGATQQRFAIVTSNANGDWQFIARNDWRHIPIHLHDYLFELIPQDFPPIGVLPSSVKEADGTFTCTFHADGDFHLQPRITNRKTKMEVTGWTASDVNWQTITSNASLYTASGTPAWYKPGSYIHGTFAPNVKGQSIHVLTLTAAPEGVAARRFVCPVIIKRED